MIYNSTTFIIPLLTTILIGSIFFALIRGKKSQLIKKQKLGLKWLCLLRNLLAHIQQHRGLSSGYLNGGKELLKEIQPLHVIITREISDISSIGNWMENNSEWIDIIKHWKRISENYINNTAKNNLLQHNSLIQNILYLIDDMALEHSLQLLLTTDKKPLHYIWRELLYAAECIGQARAIGTGVTASGTCDSISRIRLNYLCQQVETKTSALNQELAFFTPEKNEISYLLNCIDKNVTREVPDIKSTEFFEIASRALNSLYDQYDEIIRMQNPQFK